ncbi:MAG: amidohydrolase family protein, partial [Acidimicrobiales bacterium]|nr:amidohydrolase family protein [Acidimicrobiales bacterium]
MTLTRPQRTVVQRTVIKNAKLVDGTGRPATHGDLVIEGETIAEVVGCGEAAEGGARVVDLDGLVLAPGFIDPHTHLDAQVTWDPELSLSTDHGVTTVVMGNCGFGIAPARSSDHAVLARTLENVEGMSFEALATGIDWSFESFPDYLDSLDRLPLRANIAALVGHTPLRIYVMGPAATERAATPDEIGQMASVLR